MSGWTSPASSVSGNWLNQFARGSVNGSRRGTGRLVRRGFCHSRGGGCRGVRSDALRDPPRNFSLPGSRGLGGLRDLRESSCWVCGQSERRCPCLPHFQHRLVGLGASGGVTAGLALVRTVIAYFSMVIRRSTAASSEGGVGGSCRCVLTKLSHLWGGLCCFVESLGLEVSFSFLKCGFYSGDPLFLERVVKA